MTIQELNDILDKLAAGPQPLTTDVDELWLHIERAGLHRNQYELEQIFRHLTRPDLRLNWDQPPKAGENCVKTFEVQLHTVAAGLEPVLWICPPPNLRSDNLDGTQQRAADNDQVVAQWKLAFASTSHDAERWWLSQIVPASVPGRWNANLQFRLPEEDTGAFLWKLRICFHQSWAHPRLHSLYDAQYTMRITRDSDGETSFELTAGEFSNLDLGNIGAAAAGRKIVKINLAKNTNVVEQPQNLNYTALLGREKSPENPASQGITPRFTPVTDHSSPRVITPHKPASPDARNTRKHWAGNHTAELHVRQTSKNSPAELRPLPPLRLHAGGSKPLLRIGRGSDNDVTISYAADDFTPPLTDTELTARNLSISRANTELELTSSGVAIRNTGSPGSPKPGRTEVSYRMAEKTSQRLLAIRQQAFILTTSSDSFEEIRILCGGDHPPNAPPFSGYPLDLIPVSHYRDPHSNGLPEPEQFQSRIGRLHRAATMAENNGIDALLVRRAVPSGSLAALHVLLARQLWIRSDGRPIERPEAEDPMKFAAARILAAAAENGTGSVFFLQLVQSGLTLEVASPGSGHGLNLQRLDFVALHEGDRLSLKDPSGKTLWLAEFHIIPRQNF
ncbi:MAG: hypothetical protein RLZZ436_2801 [Planctomycetota bacterium]|jgi:hypothetical protein